MKSSGIGGQAVLEGVMMKNGNQYAIAVRKPDGEIEVEKRTCKSENNRALFFRLPVIRGVVAFVDSLALGIRALTYSSSFYEEEEEKAEQKQTGKDDRRKNSGQENAGRGQTDKKEVLENIAIVLLSVVLAVAFFMILPLFLSELLRPRISSQTVLALIEGVLRILLFIGYVAAISCMKDIKRVFMYHGAEHKTINCVENGLDLNVENVRMQSCQHRRCGTSFLLIVMFLSILFFVFIHVENMPLRILSRILLVPVIAGVSYEFIRFAGSTENRVVLALSKPGLLLQKLTTREPDDKMIEVAIASVEAVFDWKTYQRRSATRRNATRKLQREKGGSRSPKGIGKKETAAGQKVKKSRRQIRRELKEREERYRQNAMERVRQMQEQEQREAQLEQKYRDVRKRHAEREAAMAQKVEIPEEDDTLNRLDYFFDDAQKDKPAKALDRKSDRNLSGNDSPNDGNTDEAAVAAENQKAEDK